MINAYTGTLQNYMGFNGRTGRSEFWLFILVQCLIVVFGLILAGIIDLLALLLALYLLGTLIPTLAATVRRLHDTNRGSWWLLLAVIPTPLAIAILAVGAYFLALGVGAGLLGLLFFFVDSDDQLLLTAEQLLVLGTAALGLGAIIGIVAAALGIVLLVFLASPGTEGENKYGPEPAQQ